MEFKHLLINGQTWHNYKYTYLLSKYFNISKLEKRIDFFSKIQITHIFLTEVATVCQIIKNELFN